MNSSIDADVDLKKTNAELQQFVYAATHDLKEPLRMMTKYLQLLEIKLKNNLDDDTQKYFHYMKDGSKRMYELIEQLLIYSRVDSSDIEYRMTDLNVVVFQITHALKKATEREIEILCDPLPLLPWGSHMKVVLNSLIENGLKFNRSAVPRVRISGEKSDDSWIISVEDNGIGVDPKYFDRIFEPLKRLHGAEEFTGAGMGLAISKKIVERQGGQIWMESAIGKGSQFKFSIPISKSQDAGVASSGL